MSSRTAQSLAKFIRAINPPLDMTPREQRMFLDKQIKAFWDQLDAEHGHDKSTRTHTNKHFASILNNPHFTGPTRKDTKSTTLGRRVSESTPRDQVYLGKLQGNFARPVSIFREQVAAGEATLSSAVELMQSYRRIDARIRDDDNRDMGRLVANWIWSTGLEDSLEFVHDSAFVKLLLQILYQEGNQARIFTWHTKIRSRLSSSRSCSEAEWQLQEHAFQMLLLRHVQAETGASGLNAAVELFLTLKDMYTRDIHTEQGSSAADERSNPGKILALAGKFVEAEIRRRSTLFVRPVDMPVHTYESFGNTLGLWSSGAMLDYNIALLDLHHPTQSSDRRAIMLLKRYPSSSLSQRRRIALYRLAIEWNTAHRNYRQASILLNEEDKLLGKINVDEKPKPTGTVDAVVEWMQQAPAFPKPSHPLS